jgi:hypothetical protein
MHVEDADRLVALDDREVVDAVFTHEELGIQGIDRPRLGRVRLFAFIAR